MFELVISHIASVFAAIPFGSATWFVIAILGFFVWLFAKADKDPHSPVQWEHLIVDSSNNRASPYKTGYLVGLIVATWIVVSIADKGALNLEIFGAYLTYLLGGASVNVIGKKEPTLSPKTSDDTDTTAP